MFRYERLNLTARQGGREVEHRRRRESRRKKRRRLGMGTKVKKNEWKKKAG